MQDHITGRSRTIKVIMEEGEGKRVDDVATLTLENAMLTDFKVVNAVGGERQEHITIEFESFKMHYLQKD